MQVLSIGHGKGAGHCALKLQVNKESIWMEYRTLTVSATVMGGSLVEIFHHFS